MAGAANHSVLNVDDSASVRYIRHHILADAGFEVEDAASGAEALRLAQQHQPDVVLLDIHLPDLDGFEVCRRLRETAAGRKLVILHATATASDTRSQTAGLENGADGYLSEPIDPAVLVATVRALLRARVAEEALRQSEQRFRDIADAMPNLVWTAGPDGKIDYVNRRFEEYTGGELNPVHPDDMEATQSAWRKAMETGSSFEIEHRLRRADGSYCWYLTRAVPTRDSAGRVTRWYGAATEVHELRETREALRESERQFRLLADSIAQLAWMADGQGEAFWYNRRWYEFTGASLDQVRGWRWKALVHPDHADRVVANVRRCLEKGEAWEETFPMRARDGSFRWFLCRAEPIRDTTGRVVRWFGTSTDITSRLETEQKLRRSEQEFRELADSMPLMVFVLRPDGTSEYRNRTYLEYTRMTSEQLAEHRWEIVHPDDREPVRASFERLLRAGEPFQTEVRLRGRDGGFRWQLCRCVAPRDSEGNVTRYIGTFTDIHDWKVAQEVLQQAQKLESVGLLAGGIAHDFNNLLTGIIGNASLLLEELGPDGAGRLQTIIAGAERAAHLTRQLLAYAGKAQFVLRQVDLSQAVREMLDLVHFSLPRTVKVQLDLHPSLPRISADPGQVHQVVMNMAVNAGEAIGEGRRGVISIATRVRDVERPLLDAAGKELPSGRYVELQFADNGAGIDEATRGRIFDPFFTTKFTGRGLGLAAVAGIMRSLNGGITLESTPGQGSVFGLLFPVSAAAPAGSRGSILIVDDEHYIRGFLQAVVEAHGYRALLARNGAEALEIWNGHAREIVLVILDIVMPVMGGGEFLDSIKGARPDVRVLLTSGHPEDDARRMCPSCPDAAFLQKPYTARTIGETIDEILAG